jgi:hypothetical protein
VLQVPEGLVVLVVIYMSAGSLVILQGQSLSLQRMRQEQLPQLQVLVEREEMEELVEREVARMREE